MITADGLNAKKKKAGGRKGGAETLVGFAWLD